VVVIVTASVTVASTGGEVNRPGFVVIQEGMTLQAVMAVAASKTPPRNRRALQRARLQRRVTRAASISWRS
jgi:protein involved in polysaccharide export with SLBB domain